MGSALEFVLAALALLATPGPTNTLLATSGAATGFWRSLRLLPAELLGYMISIALLIAAVGPIATQVPGVALGLRLASAAYLLHAAWRLWRHTEETLLAHGAVRFGQVLVTTLLNPKALIFAFTIIPHGTLGDLGAAAPWMAALAALIACIGAGWIAFGKLLTTSLKGVTARTYCRAGAVVLATFAAVICIAALRDPTS